MVLTSFEDSFGQFALIYCRTWTNLTNFIKKERRKMAQNMVKNFTSSKMHSKQFLKMIIHLQLDMGHSQSVSAN